MHKHFLLFYCLMILFTIYAGELENFEADVKYLWDEYESVRRQDHKSPYYQEYQQRMTMANSRAYKIQRTAEQIGIKNIDLQKNLKGMFSFTRLGKKTRFTGEKGSRGFFYNELKKEIALLKKLNFSYESKTFTRPENSGSGELSAVKEFERLFKVCKKLSLDKKILSKAETAQLEETYFKPFFETGRMISRKIYNAKIKIHDDFNLTENLDQFEKGCREKLTEMRKQDAEYHSDLRKGKTRSSSYRKPNAKPQVRRMKETTAYRKNWERLDMSTRRLGRDIELLKEAGLELQIKGKTYYDPMRKTEEPSELSTRPPAPQKNPEKPQEIFARYCRVRDARFNAESRMNGVSQKYYDDYKEILPPRIAGQLETEYQRQIKNEMPPKLARKSAVMMIHTRYKNNYRLYNKADFEFMTNIQE